MLRRICRRNKTSGGAALDVAGTGTTEIMVSDNELPTAGAGAYSGPKSAANSEYNVANSEAQGFASEEGAPKRATVNFLTK